MDNNQSEGKLQLSTPYMVSMKDDEMYHLGISTTSHDLPALFKDVKFVCLGGSANRMEEFAHFIGREIGAISGEEKLKNLSSTDRYVLYKAGPVLSANHGIGVPSLYIILHELAKMLYYAGSSDVTFIRIGTCGGIGVSPGSVVVSSEALNAKLEPFYDVVVLGKAIRRPIVVDQVLAGELAGCSRPEDGFVTVLGKTLCTDDFYEGQARTHGAICEISKEDGIEFVKRLSKEGVRNIEMESAGFIAFCHKTNIKCAVLCVAIVNRLSDEDPPMDAQQLSEWEHRPQELVGRFITQRLGGGHQ